MSDFAIDDPYAILEIDRGAGDRAIASAYRRLARRFHPDIAGESATDQMTRINAAFDAIKTAERRIRFDETGPRPSGDTRPRTGSVAHDPLRWTQARDGTGGAGPPPGRPSGSVLGFGRHIGWSIGEIARVDPGYLEWLIDRREARPYRLEIEATLQALRGREPSPSEGHTGRARRAGGRDRAWAFRRA
jgi:curved DNA-binding protein CbpA